MLEKSAGGDLIRATAIKSEAQVQVLAGHAKDVIGKVFKVVPDDGEQRHMAFAFKLQDGKSFVYDGQSGVRYAQESLNSSKLSMTFFELKAQPKPLYK